MNSAIMFAFILALKVSILLLIHFGSFCVNFAVFFLSEHYFFLFIYRLYKKIINNANILLILDHCASFGFIREKCIICSVQVSFVRDTKQRD